MSIVCYVLYGTRRGLDAATWTELGTLLEADGFEPMFDDTRLANGSIPDAGVSSVQLNAGDARVLLNIETRASNEALDVARWPSDVAVELERRPNSLFLQAVGDGSLDFWNRVASLLAQLLDGWIYDESSGTLEASEPGGDPDDEATAIDWTTLPHPSARPFTIVFRWDRWPSLYELDEILTTLDIGLIRNASADRSGTRRPDAAHWRQTTYLGARGEVLAFARARAGGPYVRVTFDVEERMTSRDLDIMSDLAKVAGELVPMFRDRLAGIPIDVEP